MSNQPSYPQNPYPSSNIPEEPAPIADTTDKNASQNPSPLDYSGGYSAQTPSSNPFVNRNAEYSQQSANSYNSPNFSNDSYGSSSSPNTYAEQNDPYADPYSVSQSSANSWQNEQTQYQQPAQSFSQQPPTSEMNIKALLGLIFSFLFFPAGLVLSWLGFRETKNSNDSAGKIMSIIGLAIAGIQTAFFVLWFVLFVFLMIIGATA